MSQYDMRSTSVSWLTDLPSHWGEQAIKRLYRQAKRLGHPDGEVLSVYRDYGVILKSSREDNANKTPEDLSVYQKVEVGDLVINKMKSWQGSLGVSNHDGITSPDYVVYSPLHSESPRFLHYLLRAEPMPAVYLSVSNGIRPSQWRLEPEKFERLVVPLPPLSEQTQIAGFLDYETARIDALIEKQQQLIALLKEKRQAVISHAVTKGLNPNAPLRDSGVEWLGMVPMHWNVAQLRHWIEAMEQGKSPECESREANLSEWGVLKTGCVNGGVFHASENKALPPHVRPFPQYEVKPFDVLMSRASGSPELIGSVALVTGVRRGLLLSDKIFRVSLSKSVVPLFFTYLMRSSAMRTLIVRSISGAEGMANNITKAAILSFRAPMPPFEEQAGIVEHIQKATGRLEQLIDSAGAMLSVLSERRTALISAAVTGKIDVRNWTPPESKPERDVA